MGEETMEATVELPASYEFLEISVAYIDRRKKTILSSPAKASLEQLHII